MEGSSFISASDIPSKSLCGFGNWRPKYLQRFANSKCFLFLFCILSILQGAYFTYFIGILSTLEKRYSFNSSITGIILIADNLSPAFFGIFVGYFGKYAHKPKLVSGGMIITVFSCFVSSLPFILFGSKVTTTSLHSSHDSQLCSQSMPSHECSVQIENYTSIVLLFIANFLNGFGSTAYYTLGVPYMDDNVKKKNSPLYIGTTFSLRIIGPTLGFMLSSFCLQLYENPFIDPGFDSRDPRWIGAWWIGFVLLGIAIFLASVPVGIFPENINEASCSDEESNFERSLSDLFLSLKSLIRNPILFFHTLSIVFQINGLFGYFVYMPKYMESQFHKTASSASFFSGTVTMLAMVVGVFLSGLFIKKFKPRAQYLVGYIVFIEAVAGAILFSGLFMGCPSTSLEKDAYPVNNPELPKCSQHCNCSYQAFNPICDKTGMVHFSPCTAGCYSHDEKRKNFYNCSCISSLVDHKAGEDASSGFCTGDCAMFLPYLIVVTIAKMLSSTVRVGNVLVTLR